MDISELLAFSVKNTASDLHLSAGLPPMLRVHGDIRRINLPAMEHKDVHSLVYDLKVLLEDFPLRVGHDVVDETVHILVLHRGQIDAANVAMDTQHRRQARR